MLVKNISKLFPLLSSKPRIVGVTFSSSANTTTKPKEEKIKVGSYNVNYLKVGTGPHTVFCMPGALGSIWTDFKPQVEGFDRQKFTLVVWDPPGYGKSRPPERDFPPELYDRDAEYAYQFMKALNISKYSVLGWSDGGTSSLILAAKHPEAIQKLVVWGTNSHILPHELDLYRKVRDTTLWSKSMREPMIALYGEELFARYWAQWMDGMETVYNARDGEICSDLLKDIACPTYILYGEKDPMVDKVHASQLLTNITGSRLKLYPEGKHNLHIKYAEDFNKTVQEFLLLP